MIETPSPTDEEDLPLWDGRFKLLHPLWAGDHSDLGVALDLLSGMRVVIKRLRREASGDIAPFLREYRIHRQLSHPAIPRALELGFTRDSDRLCPYIVLEHVDGISLARWVADGAPCPDDFVLELAVEVSRALDHIHRQGFIHGDLSPAHVLVLRRGGRPSFRLVDFGTALPRNRVVGDELWRRPHFPAPELLAGASVDPRADLYALGMLLSWLENSRAPRAPGSPQLADFIARCLAAAPSDRPPSAASAIALLSSSPPPEIEPEEAFIQRLLGLHLPHRSIFESLARELCLGSRLEPGVTFVDTPRGLPINRLLGAAMDEAAARRARVVPVLASRAASEGLARLAEHLVPQSTESAEPERIPFLVVERFDSLSHEGAEVLARLCGDHGRILAIRDHRDEQLRGRRTVFPKAREVAVPLWTESECSAWLHRAFGRIGAPWERAGIPNPPSPLALIEWLAELYRAGRLTRAGDGYAWRDTLGEVRMPEELVEPASLAERLTCVGRVIPYRALTLFAGVWSQQVEDALAARVVREDEQGRVDVSLWRADFDPAPEVRRREIERLLRCLEARAPNGVEIAQTLVSAGEFQRALVHLSEALSRGEVPARAIIEPVERWLETDIGPEERWLGTEIVIRAALVQGDLDAATRGLRRVESLNPSKDARERVTLLHYELEVARGDFTAAARCLQRLERRARPAIAARIHLARAFALRADGLLGAAAAEADAGLEASTRGRTPGHPEGEERWLERRIVQLSSEIATDALWSGLSVGCREETWGGLHTPTSLADNVRLALITSRRARLLGRIDLAVDALHRAESLEDRLDGPETLAQELDLEAGWVAFECGRFEEARVLASGCAARSQTERLRVEARLLVAHIAARTGPPSASLAILKALAGHGLTPMDPLALDVRLTRLELELIVGGKKVAQRLIGKALGLGHELARRLHGRRAARAFRLASEAAMTLPETGFASEYARLASHALGSVADGYALRPLFLFSSARALTHDLRLAEAEDRYGLARASLLTAGRTIESAELRDLWLGHPDQKVVMQSRNEGAGAESGAPLRF